MKLDLKEWINKVSKALSTTLSWTSGGDVYWSNGSWTCPSDGFIVLYVEPNSAYWYYRLSDSSMPDTGWSHRMSGSNSTSVSQTIFVKKGAVLRDYSMSGINTIHAWYFKFNVVGGVVRKLLKALKPLTLGRGWAV